MLIREAIKFAKHKKDLSILDIGTGSGCILLTLVKELENFRGVGVDISKKCVETDDRNNFEFESFWKKTLWNKIKEFKPDIISITCLFSVTHSIQKKISSKCPVIWTHEELILIIKC